MIAVPGTTPVRPRLLSVKLIPSPHPEAFRFLKGKFEAGESLGLVTCDQDHSLFVALDEATKASPVNVAYAHSVYSGLSRTQDPLTGEAFGILSGADDDIVREGLKAVQRTIEDSVCFFATASSPPITFFPHVVSSDGEYLSKQAGLKTGDPMAYLIAPPIESLFALDAAMKAADVKLLKAFAPPTETNRGGAYLTGDLTACEAAADAFARAIVAASEGPVDFLGRVPFKRRPKDGSETS